MSFSWRRLLYMPPSASCPWNSQVTQKRFVASISGGDADVGAAEQYADRCDVCADCHGLVSPKPNRTVEAIDSFVLSDHFGLNVHIHRHLHQFGCQRLDDSKQIARNEPTGTWQIRRALRNCGHLLPVFFAARFLPDSAELLKKLSDARRDYLIGMSIEPNCRLGCKSVESGGLRLLPG